MPVETVFYASCVMKVIIKLPFDNNIKPSELQTQKEKKTFRMLPDDWSLLCKDFIILKFDYEML